MADRGCAPREHAWVEPEVAVDIPFAREAQGLASALETALPHVDVAVQPSRGRAKRLLVADMDSTIITVECIDELADYAGLKEEVAAITEQAMQGALDFHQALAARVELLRGMAVATIDQCREERVRLTPGARTLVATMRANGARCVLVSGGFTRFAEPVARAVGFDHALANTLMVEEGQLSGTVAEPIVDAEAKRICLEAEAAALGLEQWQVMAVGDGANDIPMLQAAGVGVAYRAKPAAAAAADVRIRHGDLSTLLYVQGYGRSDWVG